MTDRWQDTALSRYTRFCLGVRELQLRFGFSVTSWWRTPPRNRGLGDGDAASQHLAGTAVDVVFDDGGGPDLGLFRATAREYGLEAIPEGDHWHLEWFTNEP